MYAFAPVEPEPASAPTVSLLAAARTPADGVRWQQGMAWRSERCPQARGFDQCSDSDGFEEGLLGLGDDLNYHYPVAFRVEDRCSTRSGASARDGSRARRQARAALSFMIARELELGELTQATPYETPASDGAQDQVNGYLASPEATGIEGVWTPLAGLGALEQEARAAALGQEVFLHLPLRLLPLLDAGVKREGNILRTNAGSRVVADAGYTGAGPDGAEGLWMYATGPVTVRYAEAPVNTIVDHRTNQVVNIVDTLFAATFDACNHFALAVVDPAPETP